MTGSPRRRVVLTDRRHAIMEELAGRAGVRVHVLVDRLLEAAPYVDVVEQLRAETMRCITCGSRRGSWSCDEFWTCHKCGDEAPA